MAVLLRCSCLLSRSNSRLLPRNAGQTSDNDIISGKVASLPVNVSKFLSSGRDCTSPFETRGSFLGKWNEHVKPKFTSISCISQSSDVSQLQKDHETIKERLAVHQTIGLMTSIPMRLVFTGALLLATPLDALAETCETTQSIFDMNMPLLLFVALVGATVGGLLARQRKGELQRLNEQLRQINAALKRQAKIESYAPALSYAPVGANRITEDEVIVDPKKQDLISRLKNGKNFLRNQDPAKAFLEFKTALELAQNIEDPIEEKKAARGLGASLQRQGKYRDAIKYHSMVLAISEKVGEDSGNTEAYGAIADCYTELGDLERAGSFYDQYIARLEKD